LQQAKMGPCTGCPPQTRAGCPEPLCSSVSSLAEPCLNPCRCTTRVQALPAGCSQPLLGKDYKHTWHTENREKMKGGNCNSIQRTWRIERHRFICTGL